MNNKIKYFPALLIAYILFACSSSAELSNELQIEMTDSHIDAWLNLMPGISPGTFHFTGEITLQNNSIVGLDSLNMTKAIVYCDSVEVYTFKPYFKTKSNDEDYSLIPRSSKTFTIGTGKGLKIEEIMIKYKSISLRLYLKTNLSEHHFEINNIKVQRAY